MTLMLRTISLLVPCLWLGTACTGLSATECEERLRRLSARLDTVRNQAVDMAGTTMVAASEIGRFLTDLGPSDASNDGSP
jgi:hypothetical protein